MDKISATDALKKLGLNDSELDGFFEGGSVFYSLATEGDPGGAVIGMDGLRLRSGIIMIHDVGGGLKDFLRFRSQSRKVAIALGATELELFGGAVYNKKLEAWLLRQRFEPSVGPIPEELGGGTMEILTRIFAL